MSTVGEAKLVTKLLNEILSMKLWNLFNNNNLCKIPTNSANKSSWI